MSRRLSSAEFCFENKKTTRIACFAVTIDSKGGRRKKKVFVVCVWMLPINDGLRSRRYALDAPRGGVSLKRFDPMPQFPPSPPLPPPPPPVLLHPLLPIQGSEGGGSNDDDVNGKEDRDSSQARQRARRRIYIILGVLAFILLLGVIAGILLGKNCGPIKISLNFFFFPD